MERSKNILHNLPECQKQIDTQIILNCRSKLKVLTGFWILELTESVNWILDSGTDRKADSELLKNT
jgi:hypothetical protein